MKGYYEEITEKIEQLLQEGKAAEADELLSRELSMPYIPPDAEKEFRRLKKDTAYALSESSGRMRLSDDELLEELHGNAEAQMRAASALYESNLRSMIPEIQDYLEKDPYPDAAALLIEGIAEQEIGEEFILNKEGVEYTFWGDAIVPVNKSAGFLEAMSLLEEWLSNDHPDMLSLARTLLIHKAYLFLPLSYEKEEGETVALEVLKEISMMMDDGKTYQDILALKSTLCQIDGMH